MDVSSPAQRLAALRWLSSSLLGSDGGAGQCVDRAALDTAWRMVRTHRLLADNGDPGLHRTAAERFEEAALALSKSSKEAEAAAGTELLGLCCAEARPARFAASLTEWGLVMASALTKGRGAVQMAASGALAQLLRRAKELDEVQGVRRDAASVLGKAMPGLMAVLREGGGCFPGGLDLLGAALAVMPLSLKSNHKALEETLIGILLDPAAPSEPAAGATACLAQLPNVLASADAWQDLARTCLRACHALLDDLVPDSGGGKDKGKDAVREAAMQAGLADAAAWRDWEPRVAAWGSSPGALSLLMGRLLALLGCLLSGPCSVPVPVPTTGLLLLATRILGIDTRQLPESGDAVEFASLQLPAIQTSVLRLLRKMTRCARLAMLPSAGHLTRLLADQLRVLSSVEDGAQSTTPAQVREALYACATELLVCGGPAAARGLAEAALPACRLELYGQDSAEQPAAARGVAAKRPRPAVHEAGEREAVESGLLEGFVATRSIAAQEAAIRMLRALLDSGGASAPALQRADMDAMAVHIATACKAAADAASRGKSRDWHGLKRLQLAATEAILASVQAPSPHRPLFLSQALSIFQSGQFDTSAEVAALCKDAVRALEPLIHPRALPFQRELRAAASNDPLAPSKPCAQPLMWSAVTSSCGLQSCITIPPPVEAAEATTLQADTPNTHQPGSLSVAAPAQSLAAQPLASIPQSHPRPLLAAPEQVKATTRSAELAGVQTTLTNETPTFQPKADLKPTSHSSSATAAVQPPSVMKTTAGTSSAQQPSDTAIIPPSAVSAKRQAPDPSEEERGVASTSAKRTRPEESAGTATVPLQPVKQSTIAGNIAAPAPAAGPNKGDDQDEDDDDDEDEDGSLPDIDSGDEEEGASGGDEDDDDDDDE